MQLSPRQIKSYEKPEVKNTDDVSRVQWQPIMMAGDCNGGWVQQWPKELTDKNDGEDRGKKGQK